MNARECVWPGRPPNIGAVVAATIRETPRVELERRLGELRAALAQVRDWSVEETRA